MPALLRAGSARTLEGGSGQTARTFEGALPAILRVGAKTGVGPKIRALHPLCVRECTLA
jgi:hypothetical protein